VADDDLFTPTITRPLRQGRPPWRPQSLVVPAILGGPAAVTVLALVNGRRLGVPGRALLPLAAVGVLAVALRAVTTLALGSDRPVQLVGALAGAGVWLLVARAQKRPFRRSELRGEEPASLWWPGVAAVCLIGPAESLPLLLALR
jgi:hypothetical protein